MIHGCQAVPHGINSAQLINFYHGGYIGQLSKPCHVPPHTQDQHVMSPGTHRTNMLCPPAHTEPPCHVPRTHRTNMSCPPAHTGPTCHVPCTHTTNMSCPPAHIGPTCHVPRVRTNMSSSLALFPEWPHRQGGCLTCCGCTFESS